MFFIAGSQLSMQISYFFLVKESVGEAFPRRGIGGLGSGSLGSGDIRFPNPQYGNSSCGRSVSLTPMVRSILPLVHAHALLVLSP